MPLKAVRKATGQIRAPAQREAAESGAAFPIMTARAQKICRNVLAFPHTLGGKWRVRRNRIAAPEAARIRKSRVKISITSHQGTLEIVASAMYTALRNILSVIGSRYAPTPVAMSNRRV